MFLDHEGHRSVEDIYRTVREKDPRVGYTTVYRTMKLLADGGLAREIDLADGITRYEHLYNHAHHDHMICMHCGKSIEFYDSQIEALQDEASEQLGFKVLDHRLQIYGLCADCGG
jgi:Fur family ferric uptake transcriptional regulator